MYVLKQIRTQLYNTEMICPWAVASLQRHSVETHKHRSNPGCRLPRSVHERQVQVGVLGRELPHPLLEFVAVEPAAVIVVVRVLRVGDVRARGRVDGHHDGQVAHGHGPVVRGRGVGVLGLGVLRAVRLHLVADLVALVADGHAAAGVCGDVGARAQDGAGGGEVGGVLEALGARARRRRLVDARERVAAHGAVHAPVAELRPLDLPVGVVGVER